MICVFPELIVRAYMPEYNKPTGSTFGIRANIDQEPFWREEPRDFYRWSAHNHVHSNWNGGIISLMKEILSESLLEPLCTQIYRIQIIFIIALTFFLFSLVGLFVIDPESATYVINVINVITLSLFVAIFGGLTYLCNYG